MPNQMIWTGVAVFVILCLNALAAEDNLPLNSPSQALSESPDSSNQAKPVQPPNQLQNNPALKKQFDHYQKYVLKSGAKQQGLPKAYAKALKQYNKQTLAMNYTPPKVKTPKVEHPLLDKPKKKGFFLTRWLHRDSQENEKGLADPNGS